MQKSMTLWTVLFIGIWFVGTVPAEQWGDLTATYKFDGPYPKATKATITSDKEFCGKFHVVDESLIVNEKNGGIANVLVFLDVGRGGKNPPMHESYVATENAEVTLDNKHCRFDPHIALLRTSQTLVAGNSDSIGHNTNLAPFRNTAYNKLIPVGGQEKLKFPVEEPMPVQVACNIHPWMRGWLVVKSHPYMAVSDADGKLTIKNLPVGEYDFRGWQENAGYLRGIKVNGVETDRKGLFTVKIQPGMNDLGEIKIPASMFD